MWDHAKQKPENVRGILHIQKHCQPTSRMNNFTRNFRTTLNCFQASQNYKPPYKAHTYAN